MTDNGKAIEYLLRESFRAGSNYSLFLALVLPKSSIIASAPRPKGTTRERHLLEAIGYVSPGGHQPVPPVRIAFGPRVAIPATRAGRHPLTGREGRIST